MQKPTYYHHQLVQHCKELVDPWSNLVIPAKNLHLHIQNHF